jgi:hypothetical protein
MSKFYRIFAPKIAKLVEITLEKHTSPKFPRFSCPKKKKRTKIRYKKTTLIGTYRLKKSISEFFSVKSGDFVGFFFHKKNKNPLYELQWIFFVAK